ncbi:TadE family protein [Nocardioides sp.]|uniref:TadE family protein n=1 Tax=Nocardioides sp. TaxID=35761 RepID=UPI002B278813|nr:TadE family protein [Nocardioides sp.]
MRLRRGGVGRCADRGAVTAETALVLPILLMTTIGLVWLLSLGAAQLRVIDAARETARAVARGDDVGAAVAVGERVAPAGGRVVVSDGGGQVVARATADVAGPGGLFRWWPAVTVRAEAVASSEGEGEP